MKPPFGSEALRIAVENEEEQNAIKAMEEKDDQLTRQTPMSDLPTRQTCARCHRISLFDFHSPMWKEVAGPWSDDILCLMCFAVLGDERGLRWEEGLTITPCSLVSHLEFAAALTRGATDE